MAKSSSIDIKLEVMEVQSSDLEIKLGGVMTATTDSSSIDIKIGRTPTTNNKKPKIESLWCNLPGNVLISIIERLCYVDQIYFRAVCKDWRSHIYGLVKYLDNFPWMFAVVSKIDAFSQKFVSISKQCYLYDPIHKQKYTIENQILDGAYIHASKFGWLLLSRNIRSTYLFSFYSPFTNKIIKLPALDMKISAENIFTKVMATFSTVPTSSDCVICVVSPKPPKNPFVEPLYFEEFCVSTCCSGGGKTWNNVLLGTNGYKYYTWISLIAHVNGVFYFVFEEVDSYRTVLGAFKPGLQEWKAYPHPRPIRRFRDMDCLIESKDDENLLMSYHDYYKDTWLVSQFNEAEKNWCELENLGNKMLFVSETSTSLQLAASEKEEDGDVIGSFANTIHVANSCIGDLVCSSLFYKTLDKHPSCPQIYGWIDKKGMRLTWIQPPNMNF